MKKYTKRIVSLLLSAGMFFSVVPSSFIVSGMVTSAETSAEAEVHIWDGTSDVSWYDDEDTEFHISTPEQLAGLSELVNTGKTMEGKTFILDNDLYLNDVSTYDEWGTTPPENVFTPMSIFSGNLNGENHIISGFYNTSGMFSKIDGAYISKLNFEDIYVNNVSEEVISQIIGGMASESANSVIENCIFQGNLSFLCQQEESLYAKPNFTYDKDFFVGGIIGKCQATQIIDCYSKMSILCSTNIRRQYSVQVTGGTKGVSVQDHTESFIGGICGKATNSSKIYNCTFNGNISGYSYAVLSEACVGGINGFCSDNSKLWCCKNDGDISFHSGSTIICGISDGGMILDCYNTGNIFYDRPYMSTEIYVYGIGKGSAKNGYNTGLISSASEKSNVLAIGETGTNSYYLTGTASKGTNQIPDTAIAKSEPNMKKESFADALGDAFYYVEGEFPKLAFEVGRTVSEFDKTSLAFKEFGETQTLTLDTTYLGEPEWISSDTSVATIDENGVVTAVGNGTAMIYALCSDSKAACSVTVGYDYYLSDNELSLKKGRVHDLSVFSASTGKEVTDIDVEWCSSDDSIVSVDGEGTITTNAVGTAAITAKVADVELSCIVSVYEYQVPAVIVPDDENAPKLSETDFTISTIDSKLLSVENYFDSITWVSSNTSIAKVSKNGLVKGVSEGNTVIYALLSDGRCLKANVVVTKSEYTMGDVNLDGKFNVSDAVLLQKWLLAVPDTHLKHWENADFCEDGRIDVFDMVEMRKMLIQNK